MAKKEQSKSMKDTAKKRSPRKKNTTGDVGITLPLPSSKSVHKGIDLKEYPDVYKYYKDVERQLHSHGRLEKHLLLINDMEDKTKDIAEGLHRRLSDKIPSEKIKHIDCLDKNEGLSEMFTNISNLDKTTLVLHDFGKRDYDVLLTTFAEYAEWVDNNIPPFIVASLKKGENVLKKYRNMFNVCRLSNLEKKQRQKLKRGERVPDVPRVDLIPFVKKDLSYLRSPKGGGLKGRDLQGKIQEDIEKKFKREYATGTIRNWISDIDTGKK
jgi:hypothetical protein